MDLRTFQWIAESITFKTTSVIRDGARFQGFTLPVKAELCISEVASVVTSNSPAAYHPNTIANKREFLEKTELGS
jgi:hypothetical protein